MHTSYAMMASRVTPPIEDEGAVETRGVATSVWGRLGLSYASLCRMVIYGTHNLEIRRLKKGDRKMAKHLHDSQRKNELIMGRCIPIDI